MTRLSGALFFTIALVSPDLQAQKTSAVKASVSINSGYQLDSLISSEMALFTSIGNVQKHTVPATNSLLEMPMRHCTDKEVYLAKSTPVSAISSFIHIYFSGELPQRKLDSILLITHSHFRVRFPDSAFKDISQTNFCQIQQSGKKSTWSSPHYRAFYSRDKQRLYIFMRGATSSGNCEVIWVIVDDQYYKRIVSSIP